MNLEDIRNLIGQGDTAGAIKALSNLIAEGVSRKRRLRNDLLILSNRLKEIKRKENIGLLDFDEVLQQHTQVNNALLNLIEEVETESSAEKEEVDASDEINEPNRRLIIILGVSIILVGIIAVYYLFWLPEKIPNVANEIVTDTNMVHSRLHWDTVFVKGGLYKMGNPNGDKDEHPHLVVVNDFYMDKYEITNEEYAHFLNETGRHDPAWIGLETNYANERCRIYLSSGQYQIEEGFEKHPVLGVSWYGAKAFADLYGLRLPTEAEWEYAARGGHLSPDKTKLFAGSDYVDSVAWHFGNAQRVVQVIGQKTPNELGLYDMSGNVYEWCADFYDPKYYYISPRENPQGPDSTRLRAARGGNAFLADTLCRSTNRGMWIPHNHNVGVGFRCVKDL